MDTRQPIQDTPDPAVLSVAFNEQRTRFVCGLVNGIRSFRSEDCVRVVDEKPGYGGGVSIAAALDDRYFAVVGGGRQSTLSRNVVHFWDSMEAKKVNEFDLSEPVLGVRMTNKYFAIVLQARTVCFRYATHQESGLRSPAILVGLYNTANNPFAICCIRNDKMVLPGLTPGQVQIVSLATKANNIIPAHNNDLRMIDLSMDGELLATASTKGTLIRVFSTLSLSQTHELRRGVDTAITYSIAVSPTKQFVASTSDKGTLHIFDLRAPSTETSTTNRSGPTPHKRASFSRNVVPNRTRPGSVDFDAYSIPSASSPPRSAHSAGNFYGPPPDLAHAPPKHAPSALSALARFPGMPRALSDTRSMTSITYDTGSDPSNWQGQAKYTRTTLPGGKVGKIKNPNVPIPGLPDGRPPKGIIAWDPDGGERRLWVVGGGADAKWEVFELVDEGQGQKLKIVKTGFRRYLSRQFPIDDI